MKNDIDIGGWIVAMIIVLIFQPLICYWLGYLGGIFATWFVGERLVEGLSYLGLTITTHQIPMITGALAVFGGYFGKSSSVTTSRK